MSKTAVARRDVLVADGIDFYRHMLAELLAAHGYHVGQAETQEDALAAWRRDRPDLLILDLTLPPAGGRALLVGLAAEGLSPAPTVGLVSGFQDDSEVELLQDRGMAASVSRSAPIDDILAAVRSALFPEPKNLRKSPRAQVHIPVAYRIEDEDGNLQADVATHTFNLSADGMFVVATKVPPPPVGTRVGLRFWLPCSPEIISCEGVVIWCNQAGGRVNELYPPGMGVMFLGLKRRSLAVINAYVRERSTRPFPHPKPLGGLERR